MRGDTRKVTRQRRFKCWANNVYLISIINARTSTCLHAMELVKMRGDSLTILPSTTLLFFFYNMHITRPQTDIPFELFPTGSTRQIY
ncbi:hypothetical protein ACN38_g5748 [Penicillium nordicum]|uniref:Uncharacterized protein n=1 Tax=Penicillium nordicum TaxID=229535 RepID=A0A0M9WFX8_9EURO|nr:hypothetical protein ACN38_g5748 [Penicillium nordicum]